MAPTGRTSPTVVPPRTAANSGAISSCCSTVYCAEISMAFAPAKSIHLSTKTVCWSAENVKSWFRAGRPAISPRSCEMQCDPLIPPNMPASPWAPSAGKDPDVGRERTTMFGLKLPTATSGYAKTMLSAVDSRRTQSRGSGRLTVSSCSRAFAFESFSPISVDFHPDRHPEALARDWPRVGVPDRLRACDRAPLRARVPGTTCLRPF